MKAVMKGRASAAQLAIADPDDIVVIEKDSNCLFLLNTSSGMFQPVYLS